jgi:hypothetical protein
LAGASLLTIRNDWRDPVARELFHEQIPQIGFYREYNGKIEVHNSLLNVILFDKPQIKTRDASTST